MAGVADHAADHHGRRHRHTRARLAAAYPPDADYPDYHVYANLAESAQCSDDILLAGEQFPLNKSTKVRIQL